ncbi:MAG: hypothetical protein MUE96_04500 [Bacteroidia bacterium]|jgi:hypothetical protein|nr:hypothetical protein [Bacteroidia bacterium]
MQNTAPVFITRTLSNQSHIMLLGNYNKQKIPKNVTILRSQDGKNFYAVGKIPLHIICEMGFVDDGSDMFPKLWYKLVIEGSKGYHKEIKTPKV